MAMFKDNMGGVKNPDIGSSAKVVMPVGSGSSPGDASKIAIETSAPSDPRELGRAPASWLR